MLERREHLFGYSRARRTRGFEANDSGCVRRGGRERTIWRRALDQAGFMRGRFETLSRRSAREMRIIFRAKLARIASR